MSASPITGEAEDLETFTVTLDAAELAVRIAEACLGMERPAGVPAAEALRRFLDGLGRRGLTVAESDLYAAAGAAMAYFVRATQDAGAEISLDFSHKPDVPVASE
ncbi:MULTISPECIES: hypothetical protein [Methylobacterium]|uniref:Uncharacterized protein n=2 Tax=Pseudomonadota TaxID=1224 RepID=A0ABQ4T0S8_9HYPH|nr:MULTISPECIES: hypothetical protein [Methylobacterium]PIU08176.1 MAG: hypothetical protein COT56_02310 [Methylobacterium sp. CG09_land_8_20_14_0_10_71_15]PIU15686.1 MAG: hypothetical protein COT28_03560 [Methylobacterium sp. CG08_land_8_20_14_0_20_71_15]GBU17256.1 hypothetical protein AwMethylo_14710 [Methylobacterium sp.]GJE07833.1 hypothetical protein AOPFMNJM_3165 [Methylobacterium jeotgali]